MLIELEDALKAMDELEREDIETYGCRIQEGFDAERAKMALCDVRPAVFAPPTDDDIETIRILLGRQINELFIRGRWEDAKEQERTRERIMSKLKTDMKERVQQHKEKMGHRLANGRCSECGVRYNGIYKNFCPNFGARMTERREE